MIKFIRRKNLDIKKYDQCIANSLQSRVYAYSWYLDIVSENWCVLVLDDYEIVMPIPWKRKYFIKYISQPYFCQQLGVFSINELSENVLVKFLQKLPKFFVKTQLQFNSDNIFHKKKLIHKENYILNLDKDYSLIKKQFSKGRKHAIKVADKLQLHIKKNPVSDLFQISKKYYSGELFKEKQFKILETLCSKYPNKVEVLGVYNLQNTLLGGAVFLKDNYRITYLYSSFSYDGKKAQASSFLLNHIIENNVNQNLILDFEGSIVYGIASFYRSFGAKKEDYFLYERNILTLSN